MNEPDRDFTRKLAQKIHDDHYGGPGDAGDFLPVRKVSAGELAVEIIERSGLFHVIGPDGWDYGRCANREYAEGLVAWLAASSVTGKADRAERVKLADLPDYCRRVDGRVVCVKPTGFDVDPVTGLMPMCGAPATHVAMRDDGWISGTTWCAEHVATDKAFGAFVWQPLDVTP